MKGALVIDVDETLLTIERISYLKIFHKNYYKQKGKHIDFFGKEHYIMPRPFVKKFLELLNKKFDLIAWSIIDSKITEEKLKILDLNKYFKRILGKDELIDNKKNLTWLSSGLKISLNDIAAIDDKPEFYDLPSSVIKISPWLPDGDIKDNELMKIINLIELKFSKVVSPELKKIENLIVA